MDACDCREGPDCVGGGPSCLSVATQFAEVSLPVRLLPYIRLGELETECCGEPAVTVRQTPGCCRGCELVVTQTVCLRIPIRYGASADAGEISVSCKKPPCR